jgi:outer membrane protein assembly factor BamE (lipoprotein component of BamABCDE complex)
MKNVAVCAVVVAVLAGCAGVGNDALRSESESTVSTKIVEGKTTKDEVRAMFGSPVKTDFTDSGLEIWRYEYTNVSKDAVDFVPVVNLFGSSASGKKKELVVLFDSSNVVKRYSMSVSDVSQKTGLFN